MTLRSTCDPDALRVHCDAALHARLAADPGVARALDRLRECVSGFGFSRRRQLLANCLRLTRGMAPHVADALAECREAIGFTRRVEVFVRPEPTLNAFCLKEPNGLIVIGLSSRLLETFDQSELRFVLGHELAHAAYDHFALPMPHLAQVRDMAGPIVSKPTALELYAWCRAAELSADRLGMICSRDMTAAGRAFFKLASGITCGRIVADLDAFAGQFESLAAAPEARPQQRESEVEGLDCFSTHPFGPLRVRALVAFSRSALYQRSVGGREGGLDDDQLREMIDRDLDLMMPNYLHETSAHAQQLRRVLYAAGVLVAAADGQLHEEEQAALRALLGSDQSRLEAQPTDLDSIIRDFRVQADEIRRTIEPLKRAGVVQHLTIIASADGEVSDAELNLMYDIARKLEVDPNVIDETLATASRPMD